MKHLGRARRLSLWLALATFLPLIGCGRSFYISESDSHSLAVTLGSAGTANEVLGDLPSGSGLNRRPPIEVDFDNSSGTPKISNRGYLLTTIRGLGDLEGFEQNQKQLKVDRLANQIEDRLDQWIADHVMLILDSTGSQVRITSLDSVSALVGQAPLSVTYDAQHQRISFRGTVRVSISAGINVDAVSGLSGLVASIFGDNPNGCYHLNVDLAELPVNGWFAFSNPFSDASLVHMRIDAPSATGSLNVSVSTLSGDPIGCSDNVRSDVPSQIQDGVKTLFTQLLSSPVDAQYLLAFDNFSISNLRINPADSTLAFVYHALPHNIAPITHLVARKSDGSLYYTTKQSGSWSDFSAVPLPGSVAGDPALVASGPGQLELAAVGTNGALYYASWRDGAWGSTFISQLPSSSATITPPARPGELGSSPSPHHLVNVGMYSSTHAPVVVATAPGQVEVVAADLLGTLWHLRRVNGSWQPPVQIAHQKDLAAPPVRDPVAVWSGNQIELVYVDHQARLFAQPFFLDTGTWGAQTQVPTQPINSSPAIAACGDGRIDLVYIRPDGNPFHQVMNIAPDGSLSFNSETPIGGNLNAPPVLVCSGFQQLELVGRGNDNAFYYNHYVGPSSPQGLIAGRQISAGWQGWVQQNFGFFPSWPFYSGTIGPAMTVTSSRSGEVELLAQANGSGDFALLENTFSSSRFGQSDWKAVEWRGFQFINPEQNFLPPFFAGRPAVTLSDQQVDVVTVNNGSVQVKPVTDGYLPLAQGSPAPGPLLSSGPGALHWFTTGEGYGALDFVFANSTQRPTRFLPFPGTPITSLAATCNGGGEIDVVGVGQDQSLYHWRFLNGHWQGPSSVPFPALSVPGHGPFPVPPGSHPTQPPSGPRRGFLPSDLPASVPSLVRVAMPAPQASNRTQHQPPAPHPTQFPGKVFSAPILVDTGAGQLELLAVGGYFAEHDLYRWRFVNGSWTPAQRITTPSGISPTRFAPSMASSWGDGTVDFVVVDDANDAMMDARLLPTTPNSVPVAGSASPDPRGGSLGTWSTLTTGLSSGRHFINIKGRTLAAPALMAFGPTRLELLATGTDGYLYENHTQFASVSRKTPPRSTATAGVRFPTVTQWGWSGFLPLTNVPVTLGTAAKTADRQSTAAVNAGNGGVLITSYQGSRWQEFFPISVPLPDAPVLTTPPAVVLH